MPKRYYLTTPIYYVNSVPHIGTTLTTFVSDVVARYHRMRGEDVTLLTGTDEHGLKVIEAAERAGLQPQEFVDQISGTFREIFDGMNMRFDDFIRTTEPRHIRAAQEFFRILQEKGHIYTGMYEGWYDVSTETYFKESDLVDGKSPDGNEVRWVQEENYFFRLSAFGEPLLDHIEKNPRFLMPEVRKNEVMSFIKQGLRDISISRKADGWGIPVPGDDTRVIYVWFDALINYVSASGWPEAGWESLWPADVQFMGKDILTRFHATLWPAMLLGVGLPLPETLFGHAWLLIGGEKISKSKGEVVRPLELAAEACARAGCTKDISVDVVRFYMAATMPYENDSTFSYEDFYQRYNSDLANDLGNALHRSLAMAHKFVDGRMPDSYIEQDAGDAIVKAKLDFESALVDFRTHDAVGAAWGLVRFLNKYIDTRAPWALAKAGDDALQAVMASMLLCLRTTEGLIRPLIPATADAIATQLGVPPLSSWEDVGAPWSLPGGTQLNQPQPIFPRIDLSKERGTGNEERGSGDKELQTTGKERGTRNEERNKRMEETSSKAVAESSAPVREEITIDDFARVQLRTGRVLEAEPIEGSDKLLKLQVVIGEERRQIVAGIRQNYAPLDLVGRQVVVVVNLKPAKLRGVESQGMLLAAVDAEGGAILLQPEKEAPEGAKVR